MNSGFIVRLRPTGPWRLGPSSGARDHVDRVLHSDTLYSALTIAARDLGLLTEWLAATAESKEPVVRVSSGFPFVGRTLLVPAPKHVWPPATAGKVRWKAARFVPLQLVPRLTSYETLKEDRWAVDPVSQCVLPVEKFGEVTSPFKVAYRRAAVVDRVTGVSYEAAETACLEFTESSGIWCAVECPDDWKPLTQSLFRFIADSGVGGERSLGWGRSAAPEFDALPAMLTARPAEIEHHETGYWMLSLFAPAESDQVDWTRGSYSLIRRSGRTSGRGELKVSSAMVEEGSILIAESEPSGFARNVAPEGSDHATYRAGFGVAAAVSVRLPSFQALQKTSLIEPVLGPTASIGSIVDSAPEEAPVEDAPGAPAEVTPPESPEPVEFVPPSPEQEGIEDAPPQTMEPETRETFSVETPPVEEQPLQDLATDREPIEDSPAQPIIEDEEKPEAPEEPQ